MRSGRLRLAAFAAGALAAGLGAAPASAARVSGAAPGRAAAASPAQASIVITSVSPNVAKPGKKIVVSGDVVNPADTPLSGAVTVQLWSSSTPLASEAAMSSYLSSVGAGADVPVPGAQASVSALPPHASEHFTVTMPASQVTMSSFGVYPLAAQLSQNGAPLASAHTFVPLWPGGAHARKIRPLAIGWVWPLIDTPQRAACSALLSNELAASVTPAGRLGRLLAAGLSPSGRAAQLTWAIDPALLSDVSEMTRPYKVGGSATCVGATSRPASGAASAWLSRLRGAVARQDFFVTPYDDPDVAALAHAGLASQLYQTFVNARSAARRFFQGQPQRPAQTGPLGWLAWPPDGVADYGVLEALAGRPDQVQTVILSSSFTAGGSQPSPAPDAVATMPDGLSAGGEMNVLRADSSLTSIVSMTPGAVPGVLSSLTSQPIAGPALGSQAVQAQASTFAQEQWFLAETAVIAAASPSAARSVVVAPSRRWSPSEAVAESLLKESASEPWLKPTSLSSLIGAGGRHAWQPRTHLVSQGELRPSLLRHIREVARSIQLEQSILTPPQPGYLQSALAAVESSAWRGGRRRQRQAKSLLQRVSAYVSTQLSQVQVVQSGRVTLTGKSGPVPVSIDNRLGTAVTVGLRVSGPSGDRVKPLSGLIQVPAGAQRTVKVQVQSAQPGFSRLTLQLTNSKGVPIGDPATVTIQATQFGSLAIAIIGASLVVFVAAAAARAIRRGGRPQPAAPAEPAPGDEPAGFPLEAAAVTIQPDTVEAERTHDAHPSKGPDGHASAPGGSGPAGSARGG